MESAKDDVRNFTEIYKNFTKHQLKKELKQLKNERNPFVSRISFAPRMLCAKAISSPTNKVYSIDHDFELKYNIWSYVKQTQRKLRKFYPHLMKLLATNFKKSILSVSTRLKSFEFLFFHHLRKHSIVIHQPTLKLAK